MRQPDSLFPYYALLPQVMLFGIGYAVVGLDLARNHTIVVLGAFGKTLFSLAVARYYLLGEVNFVLACLLVADMIQVCVFVEFLLRVRARPPCGVEHEPSAVN
ncbi:MAG: hypothetical protein GEU82_18435 [Luteitalea sp.]|nr:hypothetical protein [Luteitalea sp.]